MDYKGVLLMATKCWFSWIAVTYITSYIKLTNTPILELYPFKKESRWKSILLNLVFYFALSLVICAAHIFLWSATAINESGFVPHIALFAALLHGTLASYLVLKDRSKKDRQPLAAVVLYWHLLCGLFLGLVIEMDLMEKWIL
jgi:SNF family Na+-dependent transporter